MHFLKIYIKEIFYLRGYIFLIMLFIVLSYSVYFFLDVDTISRFGSEDNLFEWLTASAFLGSSVTFLFVWFTQKKAPVFILLSFFFLLGFGEEISWGQRVFEFDTPDRMRKLNVQRELTIHNLEVFNSESKEGELKQGIRRVLEINFLFKVFTILFGVLLPFAVFHNKGISSIAKRLKFPIPPISLTIFFAVNWILFKIMLEYILVSGQIFQFYDTITEIFEFLASFIIIVISIYFYNHRSTIPPGYDLKQFIQSKKHVLARMPHFD